MAGKNALGLKGFPTPDNTPLDEAYLLFKFPNGEDWAQLILGSVQPLIFAYNWYEWGTLTPEEAAEAFKLIVDNAPYNLIAGGTPAPYWDNPEDVDDQEPPDEQPWYGEMDGVTFVESIGIWAITGFIAYSGQIGAAIAFKTFAPRFVLAWKRDGIAGAIRVFVDGVDNGLLDTNGAPDTIIEHDYVGDPELEEHDILLVLESVPE